jgi:excisionase family DNA binding protein
VFLAELHVGGRVVEAAARTEKTMLDALSGVVRVLDTVGVKDGLASLEYNHLPSVSVKPARAVDDDPSLLSADQASEMLSCSRRTLWRLVERGHLADPIRFTRKLVRWRRSDVVKLVREGVPKQA